VLSSPLKYPTTAIACFPTGKGFAVGSIEGRCGIKNIDLPNDKIGLPEDFCFKCHRTEEGPIGKLWTVNGICFNKQYGTFCTYGSDGICFFWNKDTKSRLRASKAAPWPVTGADFYENA